MTKHPRSSIERLGRARHTSPDSPPTQYSRATDDRSAMFSQHHPRDASASPPPSFTYSYASPDSIVHAPYPQHTPYHSLPSTYGNYQAQQGYHPALPSISPYELGSGKHGSLFDGDDLLSQFNMGYSPMTSMDMATTQHYPESDPNVNISNFF